LRRPIRLSPDGAWTDFRDGLYWETLESAARLLVILHREGGDSPSRGWELVRWRAMTDMIQLPQESRGSDLRWERSRWRHRLVDPSSPGRPHVEHPWAKARTKALVGELILSFPHAGISELTWAVAAIMDARMDTALLPSQQSLESWGVLESGRVDGLLARYSSAAALGDMIDRATGAPISPSDLISIESTRRGRVRSLVSEMGLRNDFWTRVT
jgi:hypothetical protein